MDVFGFQNKKLRIFYVIYAVKKQVIRINSLLLSLPLIIIQYSPTIPEWDVKLYIIYIGILIVSNFRKEEYTRIFTIRQGCSGVFTKHQ
jgi:hypothetical protein